MGNNKTTLRFRRRKPSNEPETQSSDERREQRYYLTDNEVDWQHNHHFFKRYVYQSNFSVPIEEKLIQGGCKVLDVACGPGTWLLDLANVYGNSYFFGVDLESTYPNEIKPGNVEFREADIFNGLPFPDNEFDFTHQETMSFMIKSDQWNFVISELVRVTKPGGFIEVLEYTTTTNCGPMLSKINKINTDVNLQRGVDLNITSHIDKIIELQRGISKVYRDEKSAIIGPNGGKAGMVILDILGMYHASDNIIEDWKSQGISKEELTITLENLNKELEETEPELHICRFWAQKDF